MRFFHDFLSRYDLRRAICICAVPLMLMSGCSKDEDITVIVPDETTVAETEITTDNETEEKYAGYAFNALSDKDKQLYTLIADAAENHESTVYFPEPIKWGDFRRLYIAVFRTEAQFFWMSQSIPVIDFEKEITEAPLGYKYTPGECEKMTEEINSAAAPFLESIKDMSDYEKLKAIHDLTVLSNNYVWEDSEHTGDIYGGMVSHEIRCEGYSKTIKWLCDMAGIENTVADGKSSGISHSWNKVRCGGQWYNLDATWDDPVVSSEKIRKEAYVRYDYFLIPDSDIMGRTHFRDEGDYVLDVPECTATSEGYFWKEKLCASDWSSCKAMLRRASVSAVSEGRANAEVRFSSAEAYSDAVSRLFGGGEIFSIISYADSQAGGNVISSSVYSRSTNDDLMIINISFCYN